MALGDAFYSGAFQPVRRTNPLDNTDYELSDAYKPTGSVTQPERSLTGGASAPDPGAGAHPFSPPGTSGMPGSGSSQPGTINDPYAPMLKHLSDASQRLEDAYSAPHAGTARQIFGAILSRRNPGLGGLVSGETQRNRGIEQATQDYGIASSQLAAARAQQNQLVENRLHGAQADEATAKGQQATAEAAAIPAKQKLEAAQAEAANYKEDPNLGLIDIRTKQPINDAALAPLTAPEAQVLGKQPGERVPLKLKNTASEIANRGYSNVQTEEGVFERNRNTGTMTRLGSNPKMMFSPENRIIPVAADPNNPGAITFEKAGDAMRAGAAAPGSAATVTAKATAKSVAPGGKVGEEINAFQTAMNHADLLQQAADQLNNPSSRTLAGIKNRLETEFGDTNLTNYNAIANAYAREVTKMLSGGHLTDAEIKDQGATLPSNATPETIKKVLGSYKALAASKLENRRRNVEAGMHGKAGFDTGESAAPAATNPKDPLGIL